MKEKIEQLIALQALDTEMSGFDNNIEDQQQEIIKREQSILDKEATVEQRREQLAGLEQKMKDLKEAHTAAEISIKERQNKMMQVQTSREHQALLKEIEEAKKRIKESDEELLQVMEQVENVKGELEEVENLCSGEKELLVEETSKVEAAVKKLNSRRKTVFNKHKKLSNEINGSLIKRYNKLLKKRKGLAVVEIIDGICQGCFMSVPPQKFNEICKEDAMHTCPNCQRIFYYVKPDPNADE